jgi:hypothetical protein
MVIMTKIRLILVVAFILTLAFSQSGAGIGQLSQAAAAPLAPSSGPDWDGLSISSPLVISSEGKYKMWYSGRGASFYNQFSIGYAESLDGFAWEKFSGNPVLGPADPGHWDSLYRGQVALIEDGGIYKMWYSAGSSVGPWQTGYATSLHGFDWEVYSGNPVLTVGVPGSWDEQESDGPTVIKDGSTYKMWYHGCDAGNLKCSVGYATSNDGITWSKYVANPVLEPAMEGWDASGLLWPRVIKNGITYHMWYISDGKLGYATSLDGIHWNKYAGNPVLSEGWDGPLIGPPGILLEAGTYKMWLHSGSAAGGTRGIGYAESTDGIHWNQPITNPLLQHGEAGVIIEADYEYDQVRAFTLANVEVTITVSDPGGVKAAISGVTGDNGFYNSWEHPADWLPARPDILPGDTVSAVTPAYSTTIDPVGGIDAQAHNDSDLVDGAIYAPGFTQNYLTVLCELYTEPSVLAVDRDVPADGGTFQCDFSGSGDIIGGLGGKVGYLEPDGDMVTASFIGPYMEVLYGTRSGVGGIYSIGHTFSITVTDAAGHIKATAQAASTYDGGWWGHGFMPNWMGGDCCAWSPAEPDIQPGDWVYFQSDDGYSNQVRVGTIFGTVDVEGDSVTGPIYASWLNQTLKVWCHPQTFWPPVYRSSSAEPDGSVPYFCEWQTPGSEYELWDIQPDDWVMVHYTEPDGDQVYRSMIASEGAPPSFPIYLPVVRR